jgi:hypothetical protein
LSAQRKTEAKPAPEKPAGDKNAGDRNSGDAASADRPAAKKNPVPVKAAKGGGAPKARTKSEKATEADAAKTSFMARFQAWWHGYELDEAKPATAKGRRSNGAQGKSAGDAPAASVAAALVDDGAPSSVTGRLQVAQMVWTPGFMWPGGEDFALDLAKPLGLDSTTTLLEIGSGLGGGARAVAENLGSYVTGFDFDAAVAAEAMIQAAVHSLEEKAKVAPIDPAQPKFRPDFFRAALVREALYRVEDKKVLLAALVAAVKKDRPIVIFDLFAGAAEPAKLLTDWAALEPYPVYVRPVEEVLEILEAHDVELRVNQDDTELYCSMALRAWSGFVERLEGTKVTADLLSPLVREVELWTRRIAALQAGDLKVWRLVGIKRLAVK